MKLILIRHGLTEGNLKKLYYGSTDLPLAEAGIQALREKPPVVPEVRHYSTSGMLRTEQTFRILFGDRPHVCVTHGGILCGLLARWFGGTRFNYPCDPGRGYLITFDSDTPMDYQMI